MTKHRHTKAYQDHDVAKSHKSKRQNKHYNGVDDFDISTQMHEVTQTLFWFHPRFNGREYHAEQRW
ncbi:hypothetical protein THF1C08_290027 [Vibrio jasicida]|uniref:Uncharacterized protein n=1 Tax=Vibrio jasicida TaxID=766224 RepID=A0AAU9QQS7_9VIBR|nr:hypothetical protein THF1C08_290027 [Vibrio jasicida]CAH1594239.1 hypothetical protein THF1A12_280027 [Vibrio jasicida]